MKGGGSPPALKAVQNRIISSGKVSYFNSVREFLDILKELYREAVAFPL